MSFLVPLTSRAILANRKSKPMILKLMQDILLAFFLPRHLNLSLLTQFSEVSTFSRTGNVTQKECWETAEASRDDIPSKAKSVCVRVTFRQRKQRVESLEGERPTSLVLMNEWDGDRMRNPFTFFAHSTRERHVTSRLHDGLGGSPAIKTNKQRILNVQPQTQLAVI
ncbi:hypothetical protein TNIN_224621 [Trichonephila inaurata madagascariensis]|uniref:Uncharacterized protein n=1 Tax=Trichonephila inaurata madagascariensis TaxID=2747483 RepID=A0A8X6YFN4_9ARAC|nr:hypothetical protein TNIN_224621 [Trichonephila inaurata madagascariensis]